ncbi:MAG TPA: TlpA disulfide reductase family protein [Stellaceae bacterium]|nr:TlpA disulfide reductase family protein [Stellaceae bacterium]
MRRMIAAGPPAKRPPHIGFAGVSVWFVTVAVVLLLALSAATAGAEEKLRLGEFIPVKPPQPTPEVGFTDVAGKPASFADFKGKPAVVNLWATWCQPCVHEMPSLDRLQAKLAGRLTVAAISEDHGGAKLIAPFLAKMGLSSLKVYLDPKAALGHALQVRGLPTSIVLDADGRIAGRVEGAAEWDSAKMAAVLQPFLGGHEDALKKAQR